MASERRRGLDQPALPRRRVPRPDVDAESFGRASERIARTFGTATYLIIQTAIVIVWIGYNVSVATSEQFDPYPFILLNLAFSTQAAYAAPLILLAQNRQADRDRIQYEQDRARDERSVADTQFLAREVADIRIALGDVATRDFIRSELRDLLEDLLAEQRENPEPRRAT